MRASLLAFAAAASLAFTGCIYAPFDLGLENIGRVHEVTLLDAPTDAKILLLKIDGEITDEGESDGLFGAAEGTTSRVKDVLDLARQDPDVRALIVRVNSPGGGVTASDIVYRELLAWKEATRRPVVALLMDTAASGGYYIAQAADRIVAHPTSITGSIGVLAMIPNITGLFGKIGVEVHTFKSGPNKDVGNPFRSMDESDKKQIQGIVEAMYARFLAVVAEGRKAVLKPAEVRSLADGRVFTALEAKREKLVDAVGYFSDAIAEAQGLAGLKEAKVVSYERKGIGANRRTIYSRSSLGTVEANVFARGSGGDLNVLKIDGRSLLPAPRPVFKYQWYPEIR